MNPEAASLRDLAASVADGVSVDWSTAEAGAPQKGRRLIRHLRLVESIASLYRSIPDDPEPIPLERPPVDGARWGRLVILDPIGRGTSSEVFRAFDVQLNQDVALKLLRDEGHDDGPARMLEEARRLARVRHPHVVQVFGAEQHGAQIGLWMELVRGESLDSIVRSRGPFGAREAALIGQDICAALAAVHAAGLLHRDVKAQNVVRESGGRIVLMDFGTGEELRPDGGTPRLVGTPLYLAPEIFQGRPASVQSDLFSLGVLLFHLVTGEFPTAATTMTELAAAHAQGRMRRLRDVRPDLPASFVRVIERALEADPAARFSSAGEMEAALRDTPSAIQPSAPLVKPGVTRRWTPLAVALASVLAVAVGFMAWTRWNAPEPPPAGAVTRIAVLPLVDLSPVPSAYLADALTDQLIATLGQVRALRVTSRSSTLPFKGTAASVADVARALKVDAVVEGTVAADAPPDKGGMVRVNVRLIQAGNGTETPVWSESFQRRSGDLLALQAEIAQRIAERVGASLTSAEAGRLAHHTQSNPSAEEAYLQGRVHLAGYGPQAARRALDAFLRAARLDGSNAAAHAGASRAYVRLGMFEDMPQNEARQSGLAEANAALKLDDGLADAHAALADISYFYNWDWEEAERQYRRSIELNESFAYARTYYAELLAARGRFPEALEQSQRAMDLDPQSGEVIRAHAMLLYYKRDFAAAEDLLRASLTQQPDAAGTYALRGRIAEAQGRYADALELTRQAADRAAGGGGVPLRVQGLRLLALSGEPEAAREGLAALEQEAASRKIRLSARDRAYVALALGDTNHALDFFEQAVDDRDPSLLVLGIDPRVDVLRGNARFQAILRSIGLK